MLGLTSQHLAASAVRRSASLMVSNDEAASRCARSHGSHLPCAMNVLASISFWPMSIMRAAKYRGPSWCWRTHSAAASLCLKGVSLRLFSSSGLSASALFKAVPCCNSRAESGKRKFERAVCALCRCLYRIKNILILCSGLIFRLGSKTDETSGFRIMEHVGVRGADRAPTPRDAAEQIGAALADAGEAMLPGQHASPFQRLQRLRHRASGAL